MRTVIQVNENRVLFSAVETHGLKKPAIQIEADAGDKAMLLGWKPNVSVADGFRRTVASFL